MTDKCKSCEGKGFMFAKPRDGFGRFVPCIECHRFQGSVQVAEHINLCLNAHDGLVEACERVAAVGTLIKDVIGGRTSWRIDNATMLVVRDAAAKAQSVEVKSTT